MLKTKILCIGDEFMLKTKTLCSGDEFNTAGIGGSLTITKITKDYVSVVTDDKYPYEVDKGNIGVLYRKNDMGGKSALQYVNEGFKFKKMITPICCGNKLRNMTTRNKNSGGKVNVLTFPTHSEEKDNQFLTIIIVDGVERELHYENKELIVK